MKHPGVTIGVDNPAIRAAIDGLKAEYEQRIEAMRLDLAKALEPYDGTTHMCEWEVLLDVARDAAEEAVEA